MGGLSLPFRRPTPPRFESIARLSALELRTVSAISGPPFMYPPCGESHEARTWPAGKLPAEAHRAGCRGRLCRLAQLARHVPGAFTPARGMHICARFRKNAAPSAARGLLVPLAAACTWTVSTAYCGQRAVLHGDLAVIALAKCTGTVRHAQRDRKLLIPRS